MEANVLNCYEGSFDMHADSQENTENTGAMCCEIETFKAIYQLYARSAVRNSVSAYIAMVKVCGILGNEFSNKQRIDLIEDLQAAISQALRRDDVITKLARNQFLIVLSNIEQENCETVLNRVLAQINERLGTRNVETRIQALEPVSGHSMATGFGMN